MKPRFARASGAARSKHRPLRLAATLALTVVATAAAAAPPAPSGPPNAVQGFSENRNQPIQIQSASLELRDKERIATFSENVHLVQGDTTLECRKLVVHYGDDPSSAEAGAAGAAAKSGAAGKTASAGVAAMGGPQQIQKLEAMGGVIITQKDQTATGDTGLFDMKSNSVTLIGNVVVTQGQNVVRGDRLWVDLNTGVSRVESGAPGTPGATGRVQGLFLPSSTGDNKPGAAKPAPKAAATAPKPAAAGSATTGATGSAKPGVTGSTGGAGAASQAAPGGNKSTTKPAAARAPSTPN